MFKGSVHLYVDRTPSTHELVRLSNRHLCVVVYYKHPNLFSPSTVHSSSLDV